MPAYAPAHSHYNAHSVVPHHGSSESELTDDSDESELPATSTSMQGRDHHRLIKLEKALEEAQAGNMALTQEIKILKADNVNLQMRLARAQNSRDDRRDPNESDAESSVNKSDAASAAKLAEEVRKLGKRHVILYTISLTNEAFGSSKPLFQFDDPIRYSNVDNIDLGATAELYASIPTKFHQYLSTVNSVADEFIKGMNQERSTALHLIRGVAAAMFDHEDLPSDCFTQRSFSRSDLDRIRFLLGSTVDSNGETTNSDFPPVIFEDNNPAIARGLFRNDVLFKIARVVIYGRQALTLKNSDGRPNIPLLKSSSPFSRKDCPLQTTPGLIAFAAVAVRFILSDDESWPSTGVGPKSSINYGDAFNTYKRLIIIGRHKEESRRSIQLLFQRWDDQVFPKNTKVASNLGTHQEDVEVVEERRNAEFADFFNRMQLEDDDAHADPHLLSNPESTYMADSEEMRAHPRAQPRHSSSSHSQAGAVQAIASGSAAPPAAPTMSTPSPIHGIPPSTNNSNIHAGSVVQAVDGSLQAVVAPSKSKARLKLKQKSVPATKKAQNVVEIPQVGVDDRAGTGRAVVDGGFVVTGIDEVTAGGKPAGKATRSRKGKSQAE